MAYRTNYLFRSCLLVLWLVIPLSLGAQKTYTIKMATIAPEGSSWMNEMHAFEKEIAELSDGQLKFRIYANAVQGSEKDVLRKMKLGQLDAGTFTGVGLGELVPDVRVFDLPFLFRNHEEVDYVFRALFDDFQDKFIEKGFFLTGWAEVGFIYLYTSKPVRCIDDFDKVKMWLWKDDPLAKATFNAMNIPYIPLDVTDVHTSLQTGLINGVYISPYGLLALQWFTRTDYMLDYPLTHSVGAVLMTKRKLDTLPANLREILITKTKAKMRTIVLASRRENRESIAVLKEAGMKLLKPENQVAIAEFERVSQITRDQLAGKLYSPELLDRVLSLLAEYRVEHGS